MKTLNKSLHNRGPEITSEMINLAGLCEELKIDPRIAREKLRRAMRDAAIYPALVKDRKPGAPWAWVKGSEAEQQARTVLAMSDSPN